MARVVVLGSSNIDLTVRLPRLPSPGATVLGGVLEIGPGGKGANQAVAASRAGASVLFLSAIGDTGFGPDTIARLEAEAIETSLIKVVAGSTSGAALILVDEVTGENMIGVAPGANSRLTAADIDQLPETVFRRGDVLLASLEVPFETVSAAVRRASAAGMIVILNPAPVPLDQLTELRKLLPLVEVITPNRDELISLVGRPEPVPDPNDLIRMLRGRDEGPQVVVTLGAGGCLLRDREGLYGIPSPQVTAVDTVGAGDAFNGALAAALSEGLRLRDAVVWATSAAALAVQRRGAQEGLPRRDEIHEQARRFPVRPELIDDGGPFQGEIS